MDHWRFVKTSVIGGLILLLPVALGVYVVSIVVMSFEKTAGPILERFGLATPLGYFLAAATAMVGLVLFCFALGVAVRTTLGQWFGGWLETLALNHLPGYPFLKRISQQVLGRGDGNLGLPVQVSIGDAWQIGFLIQEHTGGKCTVFVPLAPALTLGNIYIVAGERVTQLPGNWTDTLNCIGQLGYGLKIAQ